MQVTIVTTAPLMIPGSAAVDPLRFSMDPTYIIIHFPQNARGNPMPPSW
jgi:hypothetical protein